MLLPPFRGSFLAGKVAYDLSGCLTAESTQYCASHPEVGQGTLLTKLDVQGVYHTVPVHPDDRHLLGMVWKGRIYVYTTLSFGLRSAPKIFNSVADWVIRARGVRNVAHYLDDYIIMGSPSQQSVQRIWRRH